VVDDAGKDVGPNVRGQIVLTHPFPTLARTIWNDHERFVRSYLTRFPGRYQASDEAIVDDDGHIWVLGRADDVINVAGHRISTIEIESLVSAHPDVAEGAVIGVSDELKGLVPVAFVTLRNASAAPDKAELVKELKERVETGIGGIARLDRVFVTTALPKTRAGKIMRRLLRELVERGRVEGDTTGLEDVQALDAVKKAIAEA
jgi:acetyl-CoA synthetase